MCPAPQAGPRALFGICAHSVREAVLRVAVSPRGLLASGVNSLAPEVPAGRGPFRKLSPGNLPGRHRDRSEEHTSELQSRVDLVCRLLLEKKKKIKQRTYKIKIIILL